MIPDFGLFVKDFCFIPAYMKKSPLSDVKAGISDRDQILSTFSITTLTLGQS
jgi:hypothetical protein